MTALPKLPSVRVGALALLAIFLAGTTGCVSMDEHKKTQSALDQALSQLAEAENDLNLSKAKVAELEAKIAELNRLLNNSGDLGALKRERDLLAQRVEELQARIKELLANSGTPALPTVVNDALRRLVDMYPDLLEFDERLGMVRFKSDLTFDLGSTDVKPRAKEALAKFATILNMPEIAHQEIQVVGHTDDVPIRQSNTMKVNPNNWVLSTNRAWSVAEVLHSNGVAQSRVSGAGWGDQRPIVPNAAGQKGAAQNRRVDIYIRPTTVPEGITVSTPGAPRPAASPRRTPAPAKAAPRAPAATMPGNNLPDGMMPAG